MPGLGRFQGSLDRGRIAHFADQDDVSVGEVQRGVRGGTKDKVGAAEVVASVDHGGCADEQVLVAITIDITCGVDSPASLVSGGFTDELGLCVAEVCVEEGGDAGENGPGLLEPCDFWRQDCAAGLNCYVFEEP